MQAKIMGRNTVPIATAVFLSILKEMAGYFLTHTEPSSPTFLFISSSHVAMETLADRDIPWQCSYCHSQRDNVTLRNNERGIENNKDDYISLNKVTL
jgi:hypothetical protein